MAKRNRNKRVIKEVVKLKPETGDILFVSVDTKELNNITRGLRDWYTKIYKYNKDIPNFILVSTDDLELLRKIDDETMNKAGWFRK